MWTVNDCQPFNVEESKLFKAVIHITKPNITTLDVSTPFRCMTFVPISPQ